MVSNRGAQIKRVVLATQQKLNKKVAQTVPNTLKMKDPAKEVTENEKKYKSVSICPYRT